MNLGMFDRLYPSLKARAQLEEKVDLIKANRNRERYVNPMHKNNFSTNEWMQEPRKNVCSLQVQQCDPSAQYKRSWGTYKRKRGLALCYNCRRLRHLAKEFPSIGPICLCCKIVGHEVEDFPRMIAKVGRMNVIQENKSMLEDQKEKESEKVRTTLEQLKEMMNDHKDFSLPDIMKEKQCIYTRIGDFDIDSVLDEETPMNIMT
jgi:hypothetical protein